METNNQLIPASLKAGLIIGAAGIVLFLFYYIAGIQFVGIVKPILLMLIGVALNIIILVILLKKYRTRTGGYISFGNAFLYGFLALSCAALIGGIFNYLFVNFFDPEYMKNMMMAQRDWMENYMSGKASEEQVAAQLEKLDQQAASIGTVLSALKGFGGNLVFGGIIALIVGAIMKKNPEVFGDSSTGGVV